MRRSSFLWHVYETRIVYNEASTEEGMLMTNNDILRRIRYIFDVNDSNMIAIFGLADYLVTRSQISNWLKKDDDPAYQACHDTQLAMFLNGFIHQKCGKKDGAQPTAETRLTNNLICLELTVIIFPEVWHITHRCHEKKFLLRFPRDRRRWLHWLFETKKRYGLQISNYTITSNHIHLLVLDSDENIITQRL